jgi:benzoyl-CoA reductase/2-hydroxyglutaryl-CoA dehydratase subunit BcrC/BadD/HgdB
LEQERNGQRRSVQYQNLLRLIGDLRPDAEIDGPQLRASRMRSIVNCHRLVEAYKERSRVAYVSEQFPTEIAFAFEAIPWNIESMSNMLAQSADVNRILQLTEEQNLSRDICSFLRGPYGMMLANCYPRPNVVLTNNQPCEGLSKLIYISGKRYSVPILPLHTPDTIDEDSLRYLVKQMQYLISQLEGEFGVELAPDSLRAAVEHSNQAREYFSETIRLLETHKLAGVSRELHEIFGMNYFGAKQNAQICKVLFEEALELAKGEEKKGKRVMWIGQAPEESHELLQYMNRVVDIVYWAPLWEANALVLDEDEPLRSMAHRAILYHWNAERMRVDTLRMCETFGIEGFVISNVWGCRNMMGINPMLRDLAASRKLKYLTINIDLVDRNNYTFNHIKNRVDAFLELMQ